MTVTLAACKTWCLYDKNGDKLTFCMFWNWNFFFPSMKILRFVVFEVSFWQSLLKTACNYCSVLPITASAVAGAAPGMQPPTADLLGKDSFVCLFSVRFVFSLQSWWCFVSEHFSCYRQVSAFAFAILKLKNGWFSKKHLLFFKIHLIFYIEVCWDIHMLMKLKRHSL